jgi:hypothetical protein
VRQEHSVTWLSWRGCCLSLAGIGKYALVQVCAASLPHTAVPLQAAALQFHMHGLDRHYNCCLPVSPNTSDHAPWGLPLPLLFLLQTAPVGPPCPSYYKQAGSPGCNCKEQQQRQQQRSL